MKRRAVVMVAVLALAGGACGDDDDADVADDASATSDDASATTDDADSGDESGDDGGDSGTNEWCTLMDGAETPAFDELDITDPDSVENAFREVVDLMDDAADSAPDEIEEDVQVLADQFQTFFDELEDADFNIAEIDQTALDSPAADAASERIDEFCGLDDDAGETVTTDEGASTDDTGDALSGEGTIRDQTIAQLTAVGLTEDQASCIVDNVDDLEDFAVTGASDPTAFLALVETCEIDLTKLTPPGGTTPGG